MVSITESLFYELLLYGWIALAFITFSVLFYVYAPYGGKFVSKNWGPLIENRVGWMIMEAPSPIGLFLCFYFSTMPKEGYWLRLLCFVLWEVHYFNRTIIFPLGLESSRNMPLSVMLFSVCFNLINSYLNGRCLFHFCDTHDTNVLRVIAGVILFFSGMYVNISSDQILVRLRSQAGSEKSESPATKYKIPRGGLFEYVSSANYFGEILEWFGFFLVSWNTASFSFFLWTFCNLSPRAVANHKWYEKTFPNYPANRKAVIPYIM